MEDKFEAKLKEYYKNQYGDNWQIMWKKREYRRIVLEEFKKTHKNISTSIIDEEVKRRWGI